MEIRKNLNIDMEDSVEPNETKLSENDFPCGPNSPCESDISVGCENDVGDKTLDELDSPAVMTDVKSEDEATADKNGVQSPSNKVRQNLPIFAHSVSPSSPRDDRDANSSMSEDEYFRPLKRLAMSEGSPNHVPVPHFCITERSIAIPRDHRPVLSPPLSFQNTLKEESDSEVFPNQQINSPRVSEEEQESSGDERLNGEVAEPDHDNVQPVLNADPKLSGLRSFSILDILSYKPSRRKSSIPVKIVRPWDTREGALKLDPTIDNSNNQPKDLSIKSNSTNNNNNKVSNNNPSGKRQNNDRGSALDALFKMTNKTLDNLNKEDKTDAVNIFNNRQPAKKKRKSRTAFTNHQIFELEKRFLYQKYLSPADRDELAQSLGLSNAQVITWFQNRRAKLKRDMEELKRDVQTTSKQIQNKVLLEASANVVAYLKAKDIPKISLASLHR